MFPLRSSTPLLIVNLFFIQVKKASKEFKMLQKYCANTQGSRKCQIIDAFAVSRHGGEVRLFSLLTYLC